MNKEDIILLKKLLVEYDKRNNDYEDLISNIDMDIKVSKDIIIKICPC